MNSRKRDKRTSTLSAPPRPPTRHVTQNLISHRCDPPHFSSVRHSNGIINGKSGRVNRVSGIPISLVIDHRCPPRVFLPAIKLLSPTNRESSSRFDESCLLLRVARANRVSARGNINLYEASARACEDLRGLCSEANQRISA